MIHLEGNLHFGLEGHMPPPGPVIAGASCASSCQTSGCCKIAASSCASRSTSACRQGQLTLAVRSTRCKEWMLGCSNAPCLNPPCTSATRSRFRLGPASTFLWWKLKGITTLRLSSFPLFSPQTSSGT